MKACHWHEMNILSFLQKLRTIYLLHISLCSPIINFYHNYLIIFRNNANAQQDIFTSKFPAHLSSLWRHVSRFYTENLMYFKASVSQAWNNGKISMKPSLSASNYKSRQNSWLGSDKAKFIFTLCAKILHKII